MNNSSETRGCFVTLTMPLFFLTSHDVGDGHNVGNAYLTVAIDITFNYIEVLADGMAEAGPLSAVVVPCLFRPKMERKGYANGASRVL